FNAFQPNTRLWDYKHQVLSAHAVPAWRVFLWFKCIEVLMQARPKALTRMLFHRDADYRHAMRWYTRIGRRVWFHEVFEFAFGPRLLKNAPTLRDFMGSTLATREYALAKARVPSRTHRSRLKATVSSGGIPDKA